MSGGPQAALIDELVWNRVSRFWSTVYDQNDREAMNAVYEAMFRVLDVEYARLYEVNQAKSIATVRPISQRRWLRLDMSSYAEVREWLAYISGATGGSTGGAGTAGDAASLAACLTQQQTHAKHWHISFPFDVSIDPSIPTADARSIYIGYPIVATSIDIYDGSGRRLQNDRAYRVSADGTSIELQRGARGERFEVSVAIDYTGLDAQPLMQRASAVVAPNRVALPPGFDTTKAFHVLLLTNEPAGTTDGYSETNTVDYRTTRRHVGPDQITVTSDGQLLLSDIALDGIESALIFGSATGSFTTVHDHTQSLTTLVAAGTYASWVPTNPVPLGLFATVGFLANTVQVFQDGALLEPELYRYVAATNTVHFRQPIVVTSQVPVTLRFRGTTEQVSANTTAAPYHVHHSCGTSTLTASQTVEFFDDGGTFDDEAEVGELNSRFDLATSVSQVLLPLDVDAASLIMYLGGKALVHGVDYAESTDASGIKIVFVGRPDSSELAVTYNKDSRLYTYGRRDLVGSYGYAVLPDNLQGLLTAFQQQRGTTLTSLETMIEAAHIAAAGGNPLLALFYDEFPAYSTLPINVSGLTQNAAVTRVIESFDTELSDIPYLVDHVLAPTKRLQAGIDYTVADGEIQSSVDLTTGVWWCPLVVLDEQVLAKNFGSVLGDVRDSSALYRDALLANIMLRFGGPTYRAISAAVAAHLGSRIFTQQARFEAYEYVTTGYAVTLGARDSTVRHIEVLPPDAEIPDVGQPVYPGASIAARALIDAVFPAGTYTWDADGYGLETADTRLRSAQRDDVFLVTVAGELFTLFVRDAWWDGMVHVRFRAGLRTPATDEIRISVHRDAGAPYAPLSGEVLSVEPQTVRYARTSQERVPCSAHHPANTWLVGDEVQPGDAVHRELATVYDHNTRPGWHWLTSADLTYGMPREATPARDASVLPGPRGFGMLVLRPASPAPRRGDLFDVSGVRYQVVGTDDTGSWVLPNPVTPVSGVALAVHAPLTPEPIDAGYTARIPKTLLEPSRAGAERLTMATSGWPTAGRASIMVPYGSQWMPAAEIEYAYLDATGLAGVTWAVSTRTDFPTGSQVHSMSDFMPRMLNPAFVAAVQQRTSNTGSLVAAVTEQNADAYYALLRANTLVVDTRDAAHPQQLYDLLQDTLPPTSGAVLYTQLYVRDEMPMQLNDAQSYPVAWAPSIVVAENAAGRVAFRVVTSGAPVEPLAYRWALQVPPACRALLESPFSPVAVVRPISVDESSVSPEVVRIANPLRVTVEVTDASGWMQMAELVWPV